MNRDFQIASTRRPVCRLRTIVFVVALTTTFPQWVSRPAFAGRPQVGDNEQTTAESDPAKPAAQADTQQQQGQEAARMFGRILSSLFGGDRGAQEIDEEFLHLLGQPAPNFQLESLTGERVRLEDLRGKVVLLDFWATWCGPCLRAMPEIEQVHKAFGDDSVVVLGVNQGDEREAAQQTVQERGTTFAHLLDKDGSIGDAFGALAIPHTVLIDKAGNIQQIHQGYSPALGQRLIADIRKLHDGQSLFDAAKVAAARAIRDERRAKLIEKIGIDRPEQLERLDVIFQDKDVNVSKYYNPPQWVELPGDAKRSLVLATGGHRLTVVHPDTGTAKPINLKLDERVGVWNFGPVISDGQVQWAIMGGQYDDRYRIKQYVVALHNDEGEAIWTRAYSMLDVDSYPDADFAVGDVTGDGKPEILLLVQHGGLQEAGLTGPDGSTRTLTVYDSDGKQMLRSWVPGSGGAAMYVLPERGGSKLLIATNDGLTRFRVKPEAPPEDDHRP
jgi:peroxiredoxin